MRLPRAKTVSRAALFVLLCGAGAQAQGGKPGALPDKEFQAKFAYCRTCHGVNAQGFRGSFPMPRLAGQQPEYLKNQLTAFIERRRVNPVMGNVAHVLSPAMVEALTKAFHNLDPEPLGGAPKELVDAGKKIFEEGDPAVDLPPCASCHGPEAKGNDQIPRLAGQLNDYIIRKITNWDKERGQDVAKPDASSVMEPITHKLTPDQLAAVAAYVSTLR
ncbi:MAG: c-type cytochrome [Hyphomicrobiales bacterium]|nr:c-type cytochrome [Hyphomicrobiales bacterium]